jgi:ATP-dependent Lhr-like helicase
MVLPAAAEWKTWFEELVSMRRATEVEVGGQTFWVAAERLAAVRLVFPGSLENDHPGLRPPLREEEGNNPAVTIVQGWMESTGPMTAAVLARKLALPQDLVDSALAKLEASGQVLRGKFTAGTTDTEWCNRRLLARIHRLTLGRLRREIEPVSAADFMRFLFSWQHVAPGTQLHGVDGLFQILKQLQGYEISAAAWESEVLPKRIVGYTPDLLDRLCLSGEVMWGRLSPPSANVRPTRVAPVSIFLREDAPWLIQKMQPEAANGLSHAAHEVIEALQRRGASFLAELVKATGRLKSEIEDALWELSAGGFVTADGFDNLRGLVDPQRRRLRRHAAGRWALLESPAETSESNSERFGRQLLDRWGIVFRDLIARESLAPAWRDLLIVLRRMEARGEIRGGRFVSGFLGEQFAKPEAVDLLRAIRRKPSEAPLRIPASDPLNLAGIITPGARISPLMSQLVDLVIPAEVYT